MTGSAIKSVFAEFAVRMAAVAADAFIAMFVAQALHDHVLYRVGLNYADHRPTILVFLFLYFAASWLSPMRATPAQLLFGMRVVSVSGQKLSAGRAVMRSLLLIGLISATMALFVFPVKIYLTVIALAAYALLFMSALTRKHQAVHDLLVGSMVVNRRALMQWKYDVPQEFDRPAIISIIGNAVMLAIPVFALLINSGVTNTKNMRSRVAYAWQESNGLRAAVEMYQLENDRLPTDATELGTGSRTDYPEGGYYELTTNGAIRVRFTVRPELTNGSLLFVPEMTDDGLAWKCVREGELHPKYMPAFCRD